MNVDDLNKCVRSELSAIETYEQALEKHREEYGRRPEFEQLSQMARDHRQALTVLRTLVQQKGGTPSQDSGAWGAWSKIVMGTAKLFGDTAALKALKEGEESGLKEYQAILDDPSVGADVKNVISANIANQRRHITQLDTLISAT